MKLDRIILITCVAFLATMSGLVGCDAVDSLTKVEVTGKVVKPDGSPVDGAVVKLFNLTDNTDFVVGGDVNSGEGLIDPAKVANSDNTVTTATTGADGTFKTEKIRINAFLATASGENCSVDFQGFDANTGVLSINTLMQPDPKKLAGGQYALTQTFTITCAEPPEVNAEPEPEPEPPTCQETDCVANGGICLDEETCFFPACAADADCGDNQLCLNPSTQEAACFQLVCSDTLTCAGEGVCQKPGTQEAYCQDPECSATIECAEAMTTCLVDDTNSLNNVCVKIACDVDADCGTDADSNQLLCGDGGTLDAYCVPAVCYDNDDCGVGGTCNDAGTFDAACDTPVCGDVAGACPGADDICENGDTNAAQCVTPACGVNIACANADDICVDGDTLLARCVTPACTTDADCDGDNYCVNGGTETAACLAPICSDTNPCAGDGEACVNGGTADAYCMVPMCTSDADCGGVGYCKDAEDPTIAVCVAYACNSDEDCGGSTCENPGTMDAACAVSDPNDIQSPTESGWALFTVDAAGEVTDASTADQTLTTTEELLKVAGTYSGEAEYGYIMVQTGSPECGEDFPPKVDFIQVPLVDGKITGSTGEFNIVYNYGGFMKIQLTTSEDPADLTADRSMIVTLGDDPCLKPANPLTAILTWDVAEGDRTDVDLHAWNAAEEQCYYGKKTPAWAQLDVDDRKGPGPEVITVTDGTAGPFTVKVRYFSGQARPVSCKLRVIGLQDGAVVDQTFEFDIAEPREIFEVGVYEASAE